MVALDNAHLSRGTLRNFRMNYNQENLFPNIPQEMKQHPNWVLWKKILIDGQEKVDKVPYQIDGKYAKVNDPTTWTNFDNAVTAYQANPKVFAGIGYIFDNPNDTLVFVDLDHCIIDNVISDTSKYWVEKFGSYTEISQSGKGLHIFVKGKKPGDKCRNDKEKKGFEIYEIGRFCAITGNVFGNYSQITVNQKAIDELYHYVFDIAKPAPPATVTETNFTATDYQIIDLAKSARNGAKFSSLYDGNISGYESQSEADLALCSILAFYTQDESQIDRIFSSSGLNRKKWDREDYKKETIQKAILNRKGTFMSNGKSDLSLLDSQVQSSSDSDLVEVKFLSIPSKSEKAYFFMFAPSAIGLPGTEPVKRAVPKSKIAGCTKDSITIPKWLAGKLKEEKR